MLAILSARNARVFLMMQGVFAAGFLAVLILPTSSLPQAIGADERPAATGAMEAKPDESIPEVAGCVDFFPPRSKAEEKILKVLDSPAQFDMVEMPLSQVISWLKEQYPIEIQLDEKNLHDAGISLETPITKRVHDTSLRSALRLLLERFGMTAVVRDEVLLVTTQDIADSDEFCFTRTYPVGDLIIGGDFDSLSETMTTLIKPQRWDEGMQTLPRVASARCLVIRQSYEVHEEILQLLRSLRAARDLPTNK